MNDQICQKSEWGGTAAPSPLLLQPCWPSSMRLDSGDKGNIESDFKRNVIKWGKQCNVRIFQFTNTLQTTLQNKFKENNNNNNNNMMMIIIITIIIIKNNNNIVTFVKIKL